MNRPRHKTRSTLSEQAKELDCLFRIEELLQNPDADLDAVFRSVIEAIPAGFQHSDRCQARIILETQEWTPAGFAETPWSLSAEITVHNQAIGRVAVYYTQQQPAADLGPFLNEEGKLLQTLAGRLGQFIQYHAMRRKTRDRQAAPDDPAAVARGEWRVVVDLLRRTDQALYRRVLRKLFVRLRSSGIREANELQEKMRADSIPTTDDNRPTRKLAKDLSTQLSDNLFDIASRYFSDRDILGWVQRWVQEDRSSFLVATLERRSNALTEVAESIRRFHDITSEGIALAPATEKEVRVALIERFFTDQLEYINVAKEYVEVDDFYNLLQRIVFPPDSHGKLGGKSAGLFLAARVIEAAAKEHEILRHIKTPKTWHIVSDGLLHFVTHNDLDELVEHKYREIDEVRREYDRIVQVFKHSSFTPEIVQGLSMALDDFEDRPVIVRSSSLLEDRFGSAFSGKYKSLFLANQGPKRQRLEALMDAVAEVYSSTFGPDPIQYRAERGLLDFREEMGIMIQEVVGTRVGKYFFPAFAGVAFSNNEFRWSPRIRRDDGLVRLVPGLGTRAVDRISDDYPILMAPGQPGLRVNVTPDEVMRYSPAKMDVINLETNSFETVDVAEIYRRHAHDIPWLNQAVSVFSHGHMQIPGFMSDLSQEEFCLTFEGLMTKTPFLKQMQLILRLLQEKFGTPVDIEFASDGKDFYLLQCRPQAYATGDVPAPIPRDFLPDQVLFTAKRYVSNGRLPDITHIVYVDTQKYSEIESLDLLRDVGRCVGRLNMALPKRRFILMGPGRWGSRGDIKLGVSVGYADIKNTSMLIEIARRKGNYVPDLSFGTHFFQDLVESSIRYLPLYPDDPGILFNEKFLLGSRNILPEILPDYKHLADTVRVIDVPAVTGGRVLRVLMNADLDEAIGILSIPSVSVEEMASLRPAAHDAAAEEHGRWRVLMAERIAETLDARRFGVKKLYIIGSAKNATADASSDIDLLIHFAGTDAQRDSLLQWLDGWSAALAETNFQRTGHRLSRLLDVHLITDDDIAAGSSDYVNKIGAITDAARELALNGRA